MAEANDQVPTVPGEQMPFLAEKLFLLYRDCLHDELRKSAKHAEQAANGDRQLLSLEVMVLLWGREARGFFSKVTEFETKFLRQTKQLNPG